MKRIIILLIITFLLIGCSTTRHIQTCEKLAIPDLPDTVVMDNGKHDKSKYKHTQWVKKPTVDLKKGRAYWSYADIDKISTALTEWPRWGKKVEEIVNDYNSSVAERPARENKKPWYKFW